MRRSRIIVVLMMLSLLAVLLPATDSTQLADYSSKGPYVDKLLYKVIEAEDQQVLGLINDQIDMIGDSFDPLYLTNLGPLWLSPPLIPLKLPLPNPLSPPGYSHLRG